MHDGDEWEYEYHDSATEDVFVTLDLSANVGQDAHPNSSAQVQAITGDLTNERDFYTRLAKKPRICPGRGRGRGRGRRPNRSRKPPDAQPAEDAAGGAGREGEDGHHKAAAEDAPGHVQIVELHSDNPILSYNDRIFSCYWAQDLGTNLYFAKQQEAEQQAEQQAEQNGHGQHDNETPKGEPLRSLHGHDLLGLGAIKLVAVPSELHPRAGAAQRVVDPSVKIQLPPNAADTKKRQASFLEQLMTVKAHKGEHDRVIVTNAVTGRSKRGRPFTGGSFESSADRRQAEDAPDEAANELDDGGPPASTGRRRSAASSLHPLHSPPHPAQAPYFTPASEEPLPGSQPRSPSPPYHVQDAQS